MAVSFRFLDESCFPEVFRTFQEAFADYAMSADSVTEASLRNRAVKNGADFSSSVGALDEDRMIGFTIVGVDDWKGGRGAFDIVTGIVPAGRGKGIAKEMFDFVLPRLRERGVVRFVLEVLRENEPAIKAYEKAGFRMTRKLESFSLDLGKEVFEAGACVGLSIDAAGKEILDRFDDSLDWTPSWENSFSSIRRVPDDLSIRVGGIDGEPAGLLVHHPASDWILSLVVRREFRRRGIAAALVRDLRDRVRGKTDTLKMINVDGGDEGMIEFLRRTGFEPYVGQYEMELEL